MNKPEADWSRLWQLSLDSPIDRQWLDTTMAWLTSLEWLELKPNWSFFLSPAGAQGPALNFQGGGMEDPDAALAGPGAGCGGEGQKDGPAAACAESGCSADSAAVSLPGNTCCLPLKNSSGQPMGAVRFFFRTQRARQEPELQFLQAAAGMLGAAVLRWQADCELDAARLQLKHFFDASNRIILLINQDRTVRLINRQGCELLGYPAEFVVGKNWFEHFIPERIRSKNLDLFHKLVAQELPELDDCAFQIVTRALQERLIAWHCRLLPVEPGGSSVVFCSGEDITQRQKANEALWENVVRNRRLFRDSPVALWEIEDSLLQDRIKSWNDRNGLDFKAALEAHPEMAAEMLELLQVKDANRAAVDMLLALNAPVGPPTLLPLLSPASLPCILALLRWFCGSHAVFKGEISIAAQSRSPFFGILQVSPLTNFGELNRRYLLSVLDITQLRISERKLQENLNRYSCFFNDSPIAILQVEIDIPSLRLECQALGITDLQAHFNSAPEAMDQYLRFVKIMEANKAALKFFDLERVLDLQSTMASFIEPKLGRFTSSILEVLGGARYSEFTLYALTPKQRQVRGFARLTVISDPQSQTIQALVSIMDITERVKIEEELRNSEQTQRALVDNLGVGVVFLNLECEIRTLNRQFHAWFPKLDLADRKYCFRASGSLPDADACRRCPVSATRQDGGVHEATISLAVDSELSYYKIVASPVRDTETAISAVIVLMEDITIRYLTEQQLLKTHESLKRIMASIPSILITIDANDRVVNWNPAAEKVFGLAAAQTLGRCFKECGIRWNWDEIDFHLQKCRDTFSNCQLEDFRFQHPDGRAGVLDLVLTPVKGEKPFALDILFLGTDLTDRTLLQQQLLQAQKLESIGQLAAGIAHEINTPTQYVGDNIRFLQEAFGDLSVLLGKYASLLETCRTFPDAGALAAEIQSALEAMDYAFLSDEIPKAIHQSLEGVGRVTSIVRAMKDFAHPDTGEKTPVDLNAAITSTLTVARNEWKYVAELKTDFDPALPPVPCLAGEFNQVILNMVVNAAHAIGDAMGSDKSRKGLLTVATRAAGRFAEIRIADTGTGIPAAILPRIFDPFFTTKGVGKGSGQGLSISHNVIVEKHGGNIDVETEVGKGTTFIIRLPLEGQEITAA